MWNKDPVLRQQVVEYYLNNRTSLRETAKRFNVNYKSVHKWVKWFKENGKERLFLTYKRPWNRMKREIEERISLLKEKEPSLTIKKAQEILEAQGIKISIKAIWAIWKRFGYAGFKKRHCRMILLRILSGQKKLPRNII